jgi:hypothetical protein
LFLTAFILSLTLFYCSASECRMKAWAAVRAVLGARKWYCCTPRRSTVLGRDDISGEMIGVSGRFWDAIVSADVGCKEE